MGHSMGNSKASGLQISLCGGVTATTGTGVGLDLGPAKCQSVLAALALSPGRTVPVSRLVDLVWGQEPPRTAEKTLQSYVTRLRKGLGSDTIVRVGAAYRLDVEPDSVDISRFHDLIASGDTRGALNEWTGIPLAGLQAEGLTAAVDGLVEEWLGVVESDLESRIETETASAIASLTELTATYPFREGLWALLMKALYQAGRQGDALAAYRRAREQLVEHLGVEPGPRLREMEALVLGHDAQLNVGPASQFSSRTIPTGTVTFGFTDVDGASQLWGEHRRAMATAMKRHDELVRSTVSDHSGYVFARGGDIVGVAFSRATEAVAWAANLQEAMQREVWSVDFAIALRIGLHTGEAEERGQDYFGPAVNLGARIAAVGHGGQILLSDSTAVFVDPQKLCDLGRFRFSDASAEQQIHQLGDVEYPPLRTDGGRPGNLPRGLGRLIGRDEQIQRVNESLATSPIVTLVGPGGIGKTRLALAVARGTQSKYRRGAWLVELAAISAASDVVGAVASVLEIADNPTCTTLESIVEFLSSNDVLIVLDNCEHVIEGAAEFARVMSESCEHVRVLATSREGLGLPMEQLVAVPPLDPQGAAVELFNERALSVSPSFDPSASRCHVEEICEKLDGVPLAIELAAARTSTLSPGDLVARLDERLRLLTGGRRGSVERHRTLRATIQWSYDLLSLQEQVLFQRLSIFAGQFDLAAAEFVVADASLPEQLVGDALEGLVHRSMLISESGPFGQRFRLLETMHQFGAEYLLASGDTDMVARQHAEWCLERAISVNHLLSGEAEIEGVSRLDELWPNLRAAIDWGIATNNSDLVRRLIHPVVAEIYLRSRDEIADWAERLLEITPPDDEDLVAFGVTWAARRYMRGLDSEGYERLVERFGEPDRPMIRYARAFVYSDNDGLERWGPAAVIDFQEQGDRYLAELFTLAGVGMTLLRVGRLSDLDEMMTVCVKRCMSDGPPTCLNWALTMLGTSASIQGRHDDALEYFDQSAGFALPERTNSLKSSVEARAVLRSGNRVGAFELLESHVSDLVERDNIYVAQIAAVEFVNMMVAVECFTPAAQVLAHLHANGFSKSGVSQRLVAEAAAKLAENASAPQKPEIQLDKNSNDRVLLLYIRDVLRDLIVAG